MADGLFWVGSYLNPRPYPILAARSSSWELRLDLRLFSKSRLGREQVAITKEDALQSLTHSWVAVKEFYLRYQNGNISIYSN